MRRLVRYIYCAIIALLALSCDKVGNETPIVNGPIVIPEKISAQMPQFESETKSFQGGGLIEDAPESWDGAGTVDTRTYAVVDESSMDSNAGEYREYYQYWSEGDAISLFFTRANLKYVMQGYKGSLDVGEFIIEGEPTEGGAISTGYYYSVYPYKESTSISAKGKVTYEFPKTQHYSGDTYANGENGMIARARPEEVPSYEKGVLYFQNFCSYLQLRLVANEGQPSAVKQITLTSNDSKILISGPGDIEVTDAVGEPKVTMDREPDVDMKRKGSNQITLDCGSGVELSKDENNPTKFWFVVPGDIEFSSGFSVSVIYDDYYYYRKSTPRAIGIRRSHIKPMATLKPEVVKASGPIRYKYNDLSNTQPLALKNTFYGENGVTLEILDQIYDEETDEWVVLLSGTLKGIGDNSFDIKSPDIEYIKIVNEDESVTINNFAFFNCTADDLLVYNPVTSIGVSAFTGSTIKDINIYDDVTSIGTGAALGSKIENINITGNVGTIEDEAFDKSKTLESIIVDGNIGAIGENAFNSCPNLDVFNVDGNIDTIGSKAFYDCDSLNKLNVEGDVNIIGEQAFYDCDAMDKIHIHGDIDRIENQAFYRCDLIETIEILGHIEYIGDQAFTDCDSLKTVNIGDGIDKIGKEAFHDCDALENVYVKGDIQLIDQRAFFDCDNLKNVDIYGNVNTIGSEAFALCEELEFIDVDGNVGTIEDKAFYDCDALKTIDILNNIGSIGSGAFSLCDGLETVKVGGDIGTIGDEAFMTCSALKYVDIDGDVGEIGKLVFSGCDKLEKIDIKSADTIGYRAFFECVSLTEVNIPGVTYLSMGAFRGCTNLQTITLDSVVIIEDNAFMDCKSLTSAVISADCTMIGEGAFCNAASLQVVYCYAINPPFIKTDNFEGSYVFDGTHPNLVIYIPAGSLDIYLNDEFFEGQEFEDTSIEAEMNWWSEEYENLLVEM